MKSNVRDLGSPFPVSADFFGDLASKVDSIFVIDSNVWHSQGRVP